MDEKEKPCKAGGNLGGKECLINTIISDPISQDLRQQAAELARILIDLQKRFPLFFYEPPADDPDLNIDRGFKTFDEVEDSL